jgi:hypothetical protein
MRNERRNANARMAGSSRLLHNRATVCGIGENFFEKKIEPKVQNNDLALFSILFETWRRRKPLQPRCFRNLAFS